MSLKMAPIKIHIKSSSADIAEEQQASQPTDKTVSEGESTGRELIDSGKSVDVIVTEAKVLSAPDADSKDTVVSAEDSAHAQKSSSAGGACDTAKVPSQDMVDSELYEYEGDDVYFTNPTTKGRGYTSTALYEYRVPVPDCTTKVCYRYLPIRACRT